MDLSYMYLSALQQTWVADRLCSTTTFIRLHSFKTT